MAFVYKILDLLQFSGCRIFLSFVTAFILSSCGTGMVAPLPIPLSYAPSSKNLSDEEDALPMIAVLSDTSQPKSKVMRGGQVLVAKPKVPFESILATLPSSKPSNRMLNFYVAPIGKFRQSKAGSHHYYNFIITPEFERATSAYLNGDGPAADEQVEKILADPKHEKGLLWQADYLKVNALILMGQFADAEKETFRLEKYEIAAMKKNHTSRALRAEVKYWAGDIDGAMEDAAQVIREYKDWRFPCPCPTPPYDQVELARSTTAQVRASITLGMALMSKGAYKEALPWLELADQTMNSVVMTAYHPINGLYFWPSEEVYWGRGLALAALGSAQLALEPKSEKSAVTFTRAQSWFDALGQKNSRGLIASLKANAYMASGENALAAQSALEGVHEAQKLGLNDYIWRLQALRGKALIRLSDWTGAEKALRAAQDAVDRIAGTMVLDESKARFGSGADAITRDLVRVDLHTGNLPRLLEDMDRGRSRSFVTQLASQKVATERGGEIVKEIRNLDKAIQIERQKKAAISYLGSIVVEQEDKLTDKRLEMVAQLRRREPDIADALAVTHVNVETIQKGLKANSMVVYVIPAEDNEPLRLLFISSTSLSLFDSGHIHSELKALLTNFQNAVNGGSAAQQDSEVLRIKDALGFARWPATRQMYFVPSGHTHFLPWGVLATNYPVTVLPTGAWVLRQPNNMGATAKAVVLGDPLFGPVLAQLPGARAEAASVATQYAGEALLGSQATEVAMRKRIGVGVDVLHLATHALFDPVYPMQSALILTDGKKAAPLTASQIYENPISARLVVLSACETGMGRVVSGDETMGLVRSFYIGGASTVLSSLWPVDDDATRIFMETFHDKIKIEDYGQAWLDARNAVRAKGFPPSSYGAFVLGGAFGDKRSTSVR
jgi:tetratricopeptide (TPR) repeat protein